MWGDHHRSDPSNVQRATNLLNMFVCVSHVHIPLWSQEGLISCFGALTPSCIDTSCMDTVADNLIAREHVRGMKHYFPRSSLLRCIACCSRLSNSPQRLKTQREQTHTYQIIVMNKNAAWGEMIIIPLYIHTVWSQTPEAFPATLQRCNRINASREHCLPSRLK